VRLAPHLRVGLFFVQNGAALCFTVAVKVSRGLQKLLANFVFRDCRLESHPKLLSSKVYLASGGRSHFEIVAAVSKHPYPLEGQKLSVDESLAGLVLQKEEAVVFSDVSSFDGFKIPGRIEAVTVRSGLAVPIGHGSEVVGALGLYSSEKQFFRPEDVGRIQLLGALIAFIDARSKNPKANTDAAARLGRALSGLRAELELTQDELAYRGGLNRIALSQWERGRWPPSLGPIYQWCAALGLVSEDEAPQVSFLDVTAQMLPFFRDNPQELRNISPERFETSSPSALSTWATMSSSQMRRRGEMAA